MLEGKALVIAVMMLTAAPIAATDQGQDFIGEVTENVSERFVSTNPNREEQLPDKDILDDQEKDRNALASDDNVPCYTIEEYKTLVDERLNLAKDELSKEKVDEERKEQESDSKEDDRARSTDDKKDILRSADAKKDILVDEEVCLTVEEWNAKFESEKDKGENLCFTWRELQEKRKDGKKDWDREGKDWDREGKDWEKDEKEYDELEYLAKLCEDGDEESCETLEAIREKLAEDREEEESEDEADEEESEQDDGERSRNDDAADDEAEDNENERDEEENDEEGARDEEWEEIKVKIEELKEACEEGDEAACLELREITAKMMEDRKEDWDKEGKDWDKNHIDEEACLTMEEWKNKFDKDYNRDRKDKGSHKGFSIEKLMYMLKELDDEEVSEIKEILEMSDEEWNQMIVKLESGDMTEQDWLVFKEKMGLLFEHDMKEEREEMEAFRVHMAELGEACEAGDEASCEELESLTEELEDDFREENKEGECDKDRDNEEDESEEQETDESNSEEESEE